MPRKRDKEEDKWLPPRTYRGRTNYEWHPKGGGSVKVMRLPPDGRETPRVRAEVLRAYAEVTEEKDDPYTIIKLISEYHSSPQFISLAVITQKDYEGYTKRIKKVFGHLKPTELKIHHIRKFMDKLGVKYPVAANRHHSYLSTLFAWAYERNHVSRNPATGIKKFTEVPRDRLATEKEYWLVYDVALKGSYPWIAPMMEIAYLCRMRPTEALRLTEFQIGEDGIFVERGKGSKNEITGWSQRLRAAVKLARSFHPGAPVTLTRPLFHNKLGVQIPKETRKTAWGRVITQAMKEGLQERFTFHDLKARGVTNHPSNESGHKSKKMEAVYNRAPKTFDATE